MNRMMAEDEELLTHRPRGSTHAWERYHHAGQRSQRTYRYDYGSRPTSKPPSPPGGGWRYERTSGSHSGRTSTYSEHSGGRGGADHHSDEHENRVRGDSGIWRFAQVFGVFWLLSMLGGWTVDAT
jgi:hypothetical protein